MHRLLVVSYHYPPCGCSGMFRVEGFVRHLRSLGWEASVLTARRCRYSTSPAIRAEEEQRVWRAPEMSPMALVAWLLRMTRRHRPGPVVAQADGEHQANSGRKTRGRLSQLLSVPDPANGWIPCALSAGIWLALFRRPQVILSSSPPGTAHVVAASLARVMRLPWIADMRDPILGEAGGVEGESIPDRAASWLERMALRRANSVVVVTQRHRRDLVRMYPAHASKIQVIPNGFDGSAVAEALSHRGGHQGRIVISHIGEFYHDIRRPDQFLEALGKVISESRVDPTRVRVRFVGGGDWCQTPEFQALLDRTRTRDLVEVTARLPHRESLRQLADANILLLLQPSPLADTAIPAKAYEYLATGTPTLTIALKDSATWDLMSRYGVGAVVEPDTKAIGEALHALVAQARDIERAMSPPERAMEFDRARLTEKLAEVLEAVSGKR